LDVVEVAEVLDKVILAIEGAEFFRESLACVVVMFGEMVL
jgi:hypothetical protein